MRRHGRKESRFLATVALKIEENDRMQYAGDITGSGKKTRFSLGILCPVEAGNKSTPQAPYYVKSGIKFI